MRAAARKAFCCKSEAWKNGASSTYYLAQTYAKAGMNDRALQYIRKALEEGFKERKKFEEDPAFAAMKNLPEFKELMASEPRVL